MTLTTADPDHASRNGGNDAGTRLAAADALVKNLRLALTSSRTIGAAIGIIMERHKLSQDQAFGALARSSQHLNLKLHHLAEQVVLTGQFDIFAA